MRPSQPAREYATAISELVPNALQMVNDFFERIVSARTESSDFNTFILHPAITTEAKTQALLALSDGTLPDVIQRVISDLVCERNLDLLPLIIDYIKSSIQEQDNIQSAEVFCALPLSEVERERLITAISTFTSSTADVTFRVDPGLIGGFVIRMGSKVLDNSVRTQLDSMRNQLKATIRM